MEIAQGRYLNDGSEAPVAEPEDALVREVAELGGQIVDSVIHLPAAAQTMRPPIPSAVISMNTKATEPAAAPATEWHTVAKGESLFVMATAVSDVFVGMGSRTPGAILLEDAVVDLPVVEE